MKPNISSKKKGRWHGLPRRCLHLALGLFCFLVFEFYGDNTHQTLILDDLQTLLGEAYNTSTFPDLENATAMANNMVSDFAKAIIPTTTHSSTVVVANNITDTTAATTTHSNTFAVANNITETIAATKTEDFLMPTTTNRTKIFFVHVGKTGGTTLRETVLRYDCRMYGQAKAKATCHKFLETHGVSAIGKQTTGLFHYEMIVPKSKSQRDRMDLLYVVREPISRFKSSYEYINPHNCILDRKERAMQKKCDSQQRAQNFPASFDSKFYYDCFRTIEAFMSYNEGGKKDDAAAKTCRKLWGFAFRPGRSEYGHMTANYQYYTKDMDLMREDRKVWVIRTEHLWEDVSKIDILVGGKGNFSNVDRKTINKQTTVKHVGPGIQYVPHTFCCALLSDMLAFRDIINRADNFDDQVKQETNERSFSRCNVTSWDMLETECGRK